VGGSLAQIKKYAGLLLIVLAVVFVSSSSYAEDAKAPAAAPDRTVLPVQEPKRPLDAKYAYTLAFYLNQKGEKSEAIRILKPIVEKYPNYKDAGMLLKEIAK
jgi:hypothetical protein